MESGPEFTHAWQALSYAHDITEGSAGSGLDNRYLRRTLDVWTKHGSYGELLADLYEQAHDPSYDNSPNWIGLVGKLQAMGVQPR